jgi:hypothetical protein
MSEIQVNEQTKGTEKNGAGHIFDVSGSLPAEMIEFIDHFCLKVYGKMLPSAQVIEAEWIKWKELQNRKDSEIKPANTVKVIQIETTCLEDGLILEKCEYQDGVRIGSGACSMCDNYMKGSKLDFVNDKYVTRCSKYTEEQAKAQNLKYSIV